MLRIALELAQRHDRAYEDIASKFLEHYMFISDSLNNLGVGACGTKTMGSTTTSCSSTDRQHR